MSVGRFQGQPATAIHSNSIGVGLVEGDQLGDQYPGVLSSLQESPDATKVSTLYYKEDVGTFNQPSFQRAFGAVNLYLDINRFGDSGSVAVNKDIFWKGPMTLRTTFVIPYAYHGPDSYSNGYMGNGALQSQTALRATDPLLVNNFSFGTTTVTPANPATPTNYFLAKASTVNVRPRMFYSWGAAYANLREVRMNLGGAGMYTLETYANFIAVMASCMSTKQRAILMKQAGSGTLIPDTAQEAILGIIGETCEIGSIPTYTADGGSTSQTAVTNQVTAYGAGDYSTPAQTGPCAVAGPAVEHWLAVIKTPNTNYFSGQQYRRPIDTRLFSSDFMFDFITSPALDTFVDTGLGYQPQLMSIASAATTVASAVHMNYLIPNSTNAALWNYQTDGLFPSMLYRQLNIPDYSSLTAAAAVVDYFALIGLDRTNTAGGVGGSTSANYRVGQATDWYTISRSAGYAATYGGGLTAATSYQQTSYLNANNLPTPTYCTIMNTLRLTNDQLGAKQVLETRPDLAIYYPFQHFTTQTYFVNQVYTNPGFTAYSNNATALSPFVNTQSGGIGFGGISEVDLRSFQGPPTSYTTPMSVAISIPVNPLTCLYIMVLREKDRRPLGYSTPFQYSPALFWNALELLRFELKYSAQTLQKFDGYGEYLLEQIHERSEPLVVPFRGGCAVRSDLPLNNPDVILHSCSYPGAWYNAFIYELCMVDQIPIKNEAWFQQTPSFMGEQLDFQFSIKPTLKPYSPGDFDLRSDTRLPAMTATASMTAQSRYQYIEKLAPWCPGIPNCAGADSPASVNWNLNNDNLTVVCVFAQNALWQLNPLFSKVVFARGG